MFLEKNVNTNNNWTFELKSSGGSYRGMDSPTFVIVGFQVRKKIDSQTHNNATFDRLPISNAVCKIGSEKYPDDGIECDYDSDKYDQAYSEIEFFISQKVKLTYSIHLTICTNSEQIIIFMYSNYPIKNFTLRVNLLD